MGQAETTTKPNKANYENLSNPKEPDDSLRIAKISGHKDLTERPGEKHTHTHTHAAVIDAL